MSTKYLGVDLTEPVLEQEAVAMEARHVAGPEVVPAAMNVP